MMCRRLQKLPDEIGRQPYAQMMRVWRYICKADELDHQPHD